MKLRSFGNFLALGVLLAAMGMIRPAAAKDFLYVPVSNSLLIIDCDTDTVVKTVSAYNDYIIGAAPSADGKRYYLNAFQTIYAFDTATQQLVETLKLSSDLNRVSVLGFAVAEDGSKLFLSCSVVKKKQNVPKLDVLPPQLLIFDLKTKQVTQNYEIPYCVTGVITLRNDPDHLILTGLDVYTINLKDGKLEKTLGLLNPDQGAEVGNNLVICNNYSPGDTGIFTNPYYTPSAMYFMMIDRNSGKLSSLKAADTLLLYSSILSPDKKYLYAVMDNLYKVDAQTGQVIKSVPVERGTSYALSLTANGKKIYAGPSGPDISVYDTDTLNQIGVIPLDADGVAAHRISQ
jgi:DNA-binding beta-propeller fold protein YncE